MSSQGLTMVYSETMVRYLMMTEYLRTQPFEHGASLTAILPYQQHRFLNHVAMASVASFSVLVRVMYTTHGAIPCSLTPRYP